MPPLHRRFLRTLAVASLLLPAAPASAAAPANSTELEALRAELLHLRRQMNAIEVRLEDAIAGRQPVVVAKQGGATVAPGGIAPPAGSVTNDRAPAAAGSALPVARGDANADTAPRAGRATEAGERGGDEAFIPERRYAVDPASEPRPPGAAPAGAPVSTFRAGGWLKLDGILDSGPMGTRDWFVPGTIPVEGADRDRGGYAGLHARASRLFLEWRRPTEAGPARVYFEANFLGADVPDYRQGGLNFRAAHLYGQLGNWTAGRTYSTFMDIDAYPDTLDFYGPNAAVFALTTQLRYARADERGRSFALSAENPRTLASCGSSPGCSGRETMPDLVARVRREGAFGHVQAAGIVRRLGVLTAAGAREETTGTGLQLSGSLKRRESRDYAVWGLHAGRGIQRYIADPGYAPDADAWIAPDGTLQAGRVAGGYAGYTHHWSAAYRSTVSGGLSWTERGADPVSSHARTTYVSANLIWDVLTDLSVGGELLYGANDRGAGRSADMARLMLSAQYRFGG